MATYSEIPDIPENTNDPAAGLNLALRILKPILARTVISMTTTSPPGSPSNGDRYIVPAGATGAWNSMAGYLAEYFAEGARWDFFAPGSLVNMVVNMEDGAVYYFDTVSSSPGEWVPTNIVT